MENQKTILKQKSVGNTYNMSQYHLDKYILMINIFKKKLKKVIKNELCKQH